MQKHLSLAAAIVSLAAVVPAQSVVPMQSAASAQQTRQPAPSSSPVADARLSSRSLDSIPFSAQAGAAADEFRGLRISGRDLKKRVNRVEALGWHESLSDAQAAAAQSGKPIVWIQLLGDLDGYT